MSRPALLPVGPGAPETIRPHLRALTDAVAALYAPGAPTALFATPADALPPPADHPHTLVLVTDLDTLAHSNGSQWIRQDTGAPIL